MCEFRMAPEPQLSSISCPSNASSPQWGQEIEDSTGLNDENDIHRREMREECEMLGGKKAKMGIN